MCIRYTPHAFVMTDFKTVWDKTNIGENYPGVTSPLTYSFIRKAYSNVYLNFIRLVGVAEEKINKDKTIFDNMLGYVQGEVFYNIDNWYKLIKLLPGYQYNKDFFENMLGPVKHNKSIEDKIITPRIIWTNRKAIIKFSRYIIYTKPLYRKFDNVFNDHYAFFKSLNIKKLDNFDLVFAFEQLQTKFFSTWSYTIVNDFKVMVFYGVLTNFINKHFPKESNEKLISIYGVKNKPESIKPLRKLIYLAKLIKSTKNYKSIFNKDTNSIINELKKSEYEILNSEINEYLSLYGDRAFNELKLEDVDFRDKPESLIAILKEYVIYSEKDLDNVLHKINSKKQSDFKSDAKALNFINRYIYNYLSENTQKAIFKREEYRLKRAKVFNIAKSFFKEIALRMVEAGSLNSTNDIFFLYTDEVFDYIRFHKLDEDFITLVNKRGKLLKRYEDKPLPRRITTVGLPRITKFKTYKNSFHKTNHHPGKATSQAATIKAKAVVMPKLNLETNVKGKILITESTDPGWTVLFPLIKGIVIEKGGVLSHASIVARELGIPCLVLPDATKIIHSNSEIVMNTYKGFIITNI